MDRSRPLVILLGVFALACTEAAGGYRSDEISTPVGDFDVRGTLWLPVSPAARAEESPARHAAVLIVPDGGPIDRNGRSRLAPRDPAYYHAWAEELVARDVAVLRYDKRVLTHPSLAGPGWDLEDRIEEALAAFRYLRARPDVDAARVHLLGHGEGASVATALPGRLRRSEAPASVILLAAPAIPIDEVMLARVAASSAFSDAERLAARRGFEKIRAGRFPPDQLHLGAGAGLWRQWIEITDAGPAAVAALATRVLVVVPLADELLPGETRARTREAWQTIAGNTPGVVVREAEGLGHWGTTPGERAPPAELADDVAAWVHAGADE